MRLLVTGGAGFIGSHIVDGEVERGSEVLVVDNLSTGKRENLRNGVVLACVDICDREEIFRIFREFKPDVVSHQAAQASVSISVKDPYGDAKVNIMGTLNVLDACREFGVKHFVFASTGGAIYGEVPEGSKASEDWEVNPKSPYAAAKASIEHYLKVYRQSYGLSFTVLRYANVYGPRQDPYGEAGVVAIFCERLLKGLEVTVYARRELGDEGCIRDYVYVGDVEKAHSLAVRGRLVGVFNVSTGRGTTTRKLLELISSVIGRSPAVVFAPPRPGDLEVSVLDNSKISSYLDGWTSLEEGIKKTVDWFSRRVG